jgi:hypothetical protein
MTSDMTHNLVILADILSTAPAARQVTVCAPDTSTYGGRASK